MKKEKGHRHIIDMLFVVALLFLFAISALMLIALGSSIYRRSTRIMQENYDSRTAYAYITEKLRQYDAGGNISSSVFDGQTAIRIDSIIEDTAYVTYLYEYDGALMELFTRADAGKIPPEQGQKIMEIADFQVVPRGDGILEISIELNDEETITFVTAQRSSEGKKS